MTEAGPASPPPEGAAAGDDRGPATSRRSGVVRLLGTVLVAVGLVILVIAVAQARDGSGEVTEPVPTQDEGETAAVLGDAFGTVGVRIIDGAGDAGTSCAWLADNAETRARGLMGVTDPDLGGKELMLFAYDEAAPRRFYMRKTPMPLSIAFFDEDGALVSTSDMEPCGDSDDCPRTGSRGDARYAVEVAQGRLGDLGITDGARLEVGEAGCGH